MLGGNREPFEEAVPADQDAAVEPGGDLSATFLPLDDDRTLIGTGDVKARKRLPKKKAPKPPKATKAKPEKPAAAQAKPPGEPRPSRFSIRLGRSSSSRSIRAALLAAAVILPVSAFAIAGQMGGADAPAPPEPSPTLAEVVPVVEAIDIDNLVAVDVSAKRVVLEWDTPDAYEEFTYTVYRGTDVIGETSEPRFIDTEVEPSTYYYYAVAALGSLGTPAVSLQLLVPVPSKNGEMPAVPTPPPPPLVPVYTAYVPPVTTSPSPTKSASPSPSKTPSPSPTASPTTTGGGGGGGPLPTTTSASTSSPAPTCQEDPTQPGCDTGGGDTSSSPPPPPPTP